MSERIMDPLAKKYRRKWIARIVIIASAIAIILLIILAYLGTLVGNYTINMKNRGLSLTMADNVDFKNSTSRLRATSLPYTVPIAADDLPEDSILDGTDGSHNGVVDGDVEYYGDGKYLAYTFYVRNLGELPIAYEHVIKIEDVIRDENGRGIDDILRFKFFENRVIYNDDGTTATTHNNSVYAKRMTLADTVVNVENGVNVYASETRECISERTSRTAPNGKTVTVCSSRIGNNTDARAEEFYSETEIIHNGADGEKIIYPQETIRYTLVAWLEGNDPDCVGETPDNPKIIISSQIDALREIIEEQ